MTTSARLGTWERVLPVAAHGLLFAVAAGLLKVAIHGFVSPFRADWSYRGGVGMGSGADFLFGCLLASPLAVLRPQTPRGTRLAVRIGVAALAVAGLLVYVAAAQVHAALNRLPGMPSLMYLWEGPLRSSFDAHAPVWLLAAQAGGPALFVFLAAPGVAAWIQHRLWGGRGGRDGQGGNAESGRPAYVAGVLALWIALSIGAPWFLQGQAYYGAVQPLVHLARTSGDPAVVVGPTAAPARPGTGTQTPPREMVRAIQQRLGVAGAAEPPDARFPYCRPDPAPAPGATNPSPNPRSIIFLILESIGAREMRLEHAGKPLMPNLQRIAKDGVHFENFHAEGMNSSQGIVASFSGIPTPTHRRVLAHAPLVRLRGLPGDLRAAGYDTVYLHGSDLSFEQQRLYLKHIGFAELVEADLQAKGGWNGWMGWGLPDGTMFAKLVAWVGARRSRAESEPYFATLATLSTHDPYVVPRGAPRPVPGTSIYADFANSVVYLDRELGRFYQWYLANERPRGTLLVLTGDHVPQIPLPDNPVDTASGELEYRFRVPFIVTGLEPEELARARTVQTRAGGQLDIPQTLLGLVGRPRLGCYQGRDLLAPDYPPERLVVSTAGEQLQMFYIHDGSRRWLWNVATGRVQLHDQVKDPTFRRNLFNAADPEVPSMGEFVRSYLALGHYLNFQDRFAPPGAAPWAAGGTRAKVVPSGRPLIISHRGNTTGSAPGHENTSAAVASARRAGFDWVELDLRITRDGVPVVHHDHEAKLAGGGERHIDGLTLAELRKTASGAGAPTLEEIVAAHGSGMNFCIELKPQRDFLRMVELARSSLRILGRLPPATRVIVDSSSRIMLTTVESFSKFEVGYDLPQKPVAMEWLDYAAGAGFDWVYIEEPYVTTATIREAHRRGLRVMLYTVDDPKVVAALADEPPDGVMTDTAAGWGLEPRPAPPRRKK